MPTVISDPTYSFLDIPAPPSTCNAPVVGELESTVLVTVDMPPTTKPPPTPTPPNTWNAPELVVHACVVFVTVVRPEILTVPATVNFEVGVVVPTPKLPELGTNDNSAPSVLRGKFPVELDTNVK